MKRIAFLLFLQADKLSAGHLKDIQTAVGVHETGLATYGQEVRTSTQEQQRLIHEVGERTAKFRGVDDAINVGDGPPETTEDSTEKHASPTKMEAATCSLSSSDTSWDKSVVAPLAPKEVNTHTLASTNKGLKPPVVKASEGSENRKTHSRVVSASLAPASSGASGIRS